METLGEFLAQFDGMDRNLPVAFSCGIESGRSLDVAMEADYRVLLSKTDIIYHNTEDEDENEDEDTEQYEGFDGDGDQVEGNRIIKGPVIVINISGQCTSSQ